MYGFQEVRWKVTKKHPKGKWKGLKVRYWDGETYKVNKKAVEERVVSTWKKKRNKLNKTPKGVVKTNYKLLEKCGDPVLEAYARYQNASYIRNAIQAYKNPPIRCRYNSLVITGRVSSSDPNLQNIGNKTGEKECFVPRKGYVFLDGDYPGLELHCFAQVCVKLFGFSAMADALNAGKECHSILGAQMMGISYEDFIKRREEGDEETKTFRTYGKVGNFSFLGGSGPNSVAETSGLPVSKVKEIREVFLKSWPEASLFFELANKRLTDKKKVRDKTGKEVEVKCGYLEQIFVGRFLGQRSYCQWLNAHFQGLGADGKKEAGWLITKACLTDESSPLYGDSILRIDVHDQFLAEIPDDDKKEEKAIEFARLMCEGINKYLPDVPIRKVEPVLMRHWMKNAEGLYDKEGRLFVHG